jgi:hypothetical protein
MEISSHCTNYLQAFYLIVIWASSEENQLWKKDSLMHSPGLQQELTPSQKASLVHQTLPYCSMYIPIYISLMSRKGSLGDVDNDVNSALFENL